MPHDSQIKTETAESLRENLIRIAHNKGMSYDTISRRCAEQGEDVSKSTVSAFFNNPDLDLGYKKLMAISRAVSGYDTEAREFMEPLPLKPTEEAAYMRDLMEAKKDRIIDLEQILSEERDRHKNELSELRSEHRAELKELRGEFDKRFAAISRDKSVWRGVALFVLIALAVFCVIDLIDTNSGWIQASGVRSILQNEVFVRCVSFM